MRARSIRSRSRSTLLPHALLRATGLAGAALVLVGVVLIWTARASTDRIVYVSGLGAPSMPTAPLFNTALLILGTGGLLSSPVIGGHRSRLPVLRHWSVTTTTVAAGACFVVASRVTCTDGCPVPFTPGSTLQDLVHVTVAGIGFAATAAAMVQVATSARPRAVRGGAALAAGGTAVTVTTGAALSVLGVRTDVGALLEFVAMTVAVLWLVGHVAGTSLRSRSASRGQRQRRTSPSKAAADSPRNSPNAPGSSSPTQRSNASS